jgi:MFS transporter, DHA1 family, tetracycline resistance protein
MSNLETSDVKKAVVSGASEGLPTLDERTRKAALLTVFLVVFIDLLGFGIVLPLLPIYGEEFISPLLPDGPEWLRRAIDGTLLGALMASFSFMQFIFAPIWGRVSDRVGRRPILLMGLSGSVVFYALFGVASEFKGLGWLALAMLFIARIGAGISGATIATAQAVIADCTPHEQRAKGMALIGAAFGIGFTFGPLLGFGSLFVENIEGTPGYLASFLSLCALVTGFFLLRETLQPGRHAAPRRWLDWHGIRNALRSPTVGILVMIFFVTVLAFANFETTLALLNKALLMPDAQEGIPTREALKTTERINFLGFAYVGFVLMLAQGFLYRRLVNRVGEIIFMRAGILFMAIGLAGIGAIALLAYSNVLVGQAAILTSGVIIVTFAVTGFALLNPSVQSLVSRRSDPAKQGEVLGVNQSAASMSRILGPVMGIALFKLNASHVLPYIAGTVLLLGAFLLSLRVGPAADVTKS